MLTFKKSMAAVWHCIIINISTRGVGCTEATPVVTHPPHSNAEIISAPCSFKSQRLAARYWAALTTRENNWFGPGSVGYGVTTMSLFVVCFLIVMLLIILLCKCPYQAVLHNMQRLRALIKQCFILIIICTVPSSHRCYNSTLPCHVV